jgi:hypothetical protein
MATSIAVLVLLETDDPVLQPANLDVSSVQAVSRLRRAVVKALPKLTRVVAVMDEEQARLMMFAHNRAVQESGADILWPPSAYVPPDKG